MNLPRISSEMVSRQPDQTSEWLNRLNAKVETLERVSQTAGSGTVTDLPIATVSNLGVVMVGSGLAITPSGVLSCSITPGSTSYNTLTDKPQINAVTLSGNKSLQDLDINPISDTEIDAIINAL